MAGTSVATAKVTGAVSQVWAANPQLSYRQVIDILKSTATDLKEPNWDGETGAGLLNMAAALALAGVTTGEAYNPTPWVTPGTWSGEGKVTPEERAVSYTDDINNEYQQTQGLLGSPRNNTYFNAGTTSAAPAGTTGIGKDYEWGSIHWSQQYGAVALWRDLQREYEEYSSPNGSGGWLGFPTKREYDWNGGKRTDFEGGYIYWDGQRAKAYRLNELPSGVSVPNWETAIENEYQQTKGLLGNPRNNTYFNAGTTSAAPAGTTGKGKDYEWGSIHWSQQYGAVALWRDLQREYEEYSSPNGSGGWLGFPTRREYDWNGGKRTDFEGGYIYWDGQRAKAYRLNELPPTNLPTAPAPGNGKVPVNAGVFDKTVVSSGVVNHYYKNGYLTVQPSGQASWYGYPLLVISGSAQVINEPVPLGEELPSRKDGTLLRGKDKVYQMQSGKRRWIPDAETFNAMGLSWSDIKDFPINDVDTVPLGEELPSRKDGTLLRGKDKVYQMQSGKRRWIPDAETFNAMGLSWSDIKDFSINDVDTVSLGEDLPSRKDGTLLRGKDKVYQMQSGKRRWIPDAETFNAMGLSWSDIKDFPINDVDTVPLGEDLPSRKDGTLLSVSGGGKVYQMQSGKRRWIPDVQTFDAMGLDWSNIKYFPINDVDTVPLGEDLPSRKDGNLFGSGQVRPETLALIEKYDRVYSNNPPQQGYTGDVFTGTNYLSLNGSPEFSEMWGKLFQTTTQPNSDGGYLDHYAYIAPNSVHNNTYHAGIDFGVPSGTPVKALVGGEVVYVGTWDGKKTSSSNPMYSGEWGTIAIYNATLKQTFMYLHMGTSQFSEGDPIQAGTVIGTSGSTGAASPHLHLEVKPTPSKPNGSTVKGLLPQDRKNWQTVEDLTDNPLTAYLAARDKGLTEGGGTVVNPPQNYGGSVAVPFTEDDVDILARTIYGEARSESLQGQIAVAWVIKNRALKSPQYGWPKDISDVSQQPWQFSAWNDNDPNKAIMQALGGQTLESYKQIARDVLEGRVPDPTGDADHYYNPAVASPSWQNAGEKTAVIGNHLFRKLVN